MDTIGLQHAGGKNNAIHEEWHKQSVIFIGKIGVHGFELLQVLRAIIGRQFYAGEQNLRAAILAEFNHAGHVGPGQVRINTPEAVICAQFDHYDFWLVGIEQARKPRQTALGGITADTGVQDTVRVALLIETKLQKVHPGLFPVHTVSGAEAVTQDQDDRRISRQ